MFKFGVILLLLLTVIGQGFALKCYRCVSTEAGCGVPFNWLWHWTKACPDPQDVCVKILEESHGNTLITRDCLSAMQKIRTDVPTDHFEGCRPALKPGQNVNNSKEVDIHKNHYDRITWCFCFLDYRCNDSIANSWSIILTGFGLAISFFTFFNFR